MLFNASEKKGILIILLLVTALIVVPRQFRCHRHDLFLLPIEMKIQGDSIVSVQENKAVALHKKQYSRPYKQLPVELNTADSATLVKIRGIGPYYAMKIIRYRNRLGGYHSVEQLKELNMKYFNVDSCQGSFDVNPELIVKRNLDSMDFKEILRHPYLEYEDVQLIFIAKRKYNQLNYSLLEEKKILPPRTLKKIKPYFR